MNIQLWQRNIPYNTNEGIKYMAIREKYNVDLLKKVIEAKNRPPVPDNDNTSLTWGETLLFALVSLFGTALFCAGVAALWYFIIAEAVR